MSTPLLVVGSVAFDTLTTRAGHREQILGGAATYAALCAAHFSRVNMVAVVGKDDFPKSYIEMFTQKGVDTTGLELADGQTFRWTGEYAADFSSRTTLDTQLGVFEHFDPKIPSAYQDAEVVLLGNIHPAIQKQVIDALNTRPFVITDTMNLWIDIARTDLDKVIACTDLLVINDEEAVQLTGELQIQVAARKILNMGPTYTVIKRGEHGAYLFGKDALFFVPAIPLDAVIDPTGAGDSFVGGLAGHLAGSGDLSFNAICKGMQLGTAVASATCEGFGTEHTQTLDRTEINRRMTLLQKMVTIQTINS